MQQPQIQIEIRPDVAARYGIEPVRIAQAVEWYMRGNRATEYVEFDRKIGIIVRLPDAQRFDAQTLQVIRVDGIPLRELVEIREALGPAEIHREDQGRVVVVYADVTEGGLGAAVTPDRANQDRSPMIPFTSGPKDMVYPR